MAAAALATNTAMAETLKVPFTFTVDGKDFPAGLYSVQRQSSQNVVTLISKDASQSFTWVVAAGEPAPTDTAVTLRFTGLAETHALRSVQYGQLITPRLGKGAMPTPSVTGQ